MSELIERQIKQLLAMDKISARAFSDALFGPVGLFNRLAHSEQERRTVAQSPLFQQAQARLTELEQVEADALRAEIERVHGVRTKSLHAAAKSSPPAAAPAGISPQPEPK